MTQKPDGCKDCPLYISGEGFVYQKKLPEKPVLLIQSDLISTKDVITGEPFGGEEGHWLRRNILGNAAIPDGSVVVDTTLRCLLHGQYNAYPTGKVRKEAEQTCLQYKPWDNYSSTPLLLMGKKAIGQFMDDERVSRWHGDVRVEGERIIGATYHPSTVMGNPNLLPLVVQEVRNLMKASNNPKLLKRPVVHKGWIKEENNGFTFDLEWNELGSVSVLGVSYDGREAYSTYLNQGSDYHTDFLKAAFEKGTRVSGHNIISADLRICGFTAKEIRHIVSGGNVQDTMIMAHIVHPHFAELGLYGLSDMVKYYEPVGEWKHDKQDVLTYNGRDAAYNERLWRHLDRDIRYTKQEHLLVHDSKLAALAVSSKERGIKIDTKALLKYAAERKQTREELKKGFTFNPDSPVKIKKWAKEECQINLRNTEYDTLVKYEGINEIFDQLIEYKEDSKQLKTWFPIVYEEDGIYCEEFIFPDFNVTGTDVARFSSSNPNVQNIPGGGERLLPGGRIKNMPNLRQFLIPRDSSLRFVSFDYSQLEDWTIAVVSGDKTLLEDLTSGRDIHRQTAAEYIKRIRKIEVDPNSFDKKGPERFKGKQTNHSAKYVISPHGLASRMFGRTTKENIEDAANLLTAYFTRYKGIRQFHEQIATAISRGDNSVRNLFGRHRKIYATESRQRRGLFHPKIVELFIEATKRATHCHGCSNGADLVNRRGVQIAEELGLDWLMTIHDELVYELDRGEQGDKHIAQIHDMLYAPIPEFGGIQIPVGIAIGDSYGTLKET